uniref:Uncharacterized protein MANES_09G147900 n=1 Tax=Rhizophora mucronata TaxID=61149 RepID=A0A2P2MR51_RHIMU
MITTLSFGNYILEELWAGFWGNIIREKLCLTLLYASQLQHLWHILGRKICRSLLALNYFMHSFDKKMSMFTLFHWSVLYPSYNPFKYCHILVYFIATDAHGYRLSFILFFLYSFCYFHINT